MPARQAESVPDIRLVRDLVKAYLEVCHAPVQDERRELWRRKNSLEPCRPLIYARAFAWPEMPEARLQCRTPLWRGYENALRQQLFRAALDDDSVFEPWLTVRAAFSVQGWGVCPTVQRPDEPGGAHKLDYPLRDIEAAVSRLRPPHHCIDETATAERFACVGDALGDLIPVNLDRGPAYLVWRGDLSSDLHVLRGIENFMMDMIDQPRALHRLLSFMSDGVLRTHDQAEAAGDWGLCNHQNQAMTYARELPDPAANVRGVVRGQLWGYMAAQEFTGVSPAMHDEFLLQYQLPILRHFGLVSYGCCEDLTQKIDMLRQIPNLRRIAVTPFADVAACAACIGNDYVISYRPSPADMVSYGLDAARIRGILRRDFRALDGCHFDVTLKDVQTVEGDPNRVRNWVELTRDLIDAEC